MSQINTLGSVPVSPDDLVLPGHEPDTFRDIRLLHTMGVCRSLLYQLMCGPLNYAWQIRILIE